MHEDILIRLAVAAAPVPAQDSVVVASPLPGGVAAFVRFLLSVPQWIQIWGFVVGVLLAAALAYVAWRHRRSLVQWLLSQSRGIKIAAAAALAALVLAAAGGGAVSWNYMQHDNDFCTGCHVMGPAFTRFRASEHDTLSCHDCHQQSIFASARQLYLWVLERPAEIGPHAPVPNRVCETCHVTGQSEVWQRIASTAGHRAHLESDSSALQGVMCVTCHGLEVHRFVPVDSTCAQSDCHVGTTIAIGTMRDQTALHCVTCHQFTAVVPSLATRDSAAGTLVPGIDQCFACHEMQEVAATFDPALDPHGGTCGTCHNPHEQAAARDANATCATAQCHGDWRNEPFHIGQRHVRVGQQCGVCHEPHRAKVDASDCEACHAAAAERPDLPRALRERLRRLAPFDTSAALRRTSAAPLPPHGRVQSTARTTPGHEPSATPSGVDSRDSPRGKGDVPSQVAVSQQIPVAQPDTFSHRKHDSLSCLTCHTTTGGHGALRFAPPRGCQICHHQAPATSECTACHRIADYGAAQTVQVEVRVDTAIRRRPVEFFHRPHNSLTCVTCHAAAVSLAVGSAVRTCGDCHDDHHAPARSCGSCHASDHIAAAHTPPVDAHVSCDACHAAETVARLLPDRDLCLTCHVDQREHHVEKACTSCHMLASPSEFRRRLLRESS